MEWFNNFWSIYSNLVLTLGTNSLLALSIYLTLSCGMLALANAAFMGIGAYTASVLTMNYGLPFPVVLLAGMAAPALMAFVIGKPTLRLSGVYLAMATLAFGEVVRIALLNAESFTGNRPNGGMWLWH
jgi:branched-chain amino acid transport system permease protein